MQTFLPYPDYYQSMQCLDPKRLGNQVYREGLTLLRGKWPNHPASKMWRGCKVSLCDYLLAGLVVLCERGFNYPHHEEEIIRRRKFWFEYEHGNLPPRWLGNDDFHAAHRSNLLRKNPDWYGQFNWTEPDNLPYIWPTS